MTIAVTNDSLRAEARRKLFGTLVRHQVCDVAPARGALKVARYWFRLLAPVGFPLILEL